MKGLVTSQRAVTLPGLFGAQQTLYDRAALLISREIVTHCVRQSLRSCQTPHLLDAVAPLKMTTLKQGALQPKL